LAGRSPTSPDDSLYRALATSIAAGRGYLDSGWMPFSIRPPGYPALFAPVLEIAGPGATAPWIAQTLMAGVAVALLFYLVRRWAGWIPAIAVVLAAVFVGDVAEVASSLRPDLPAGIAILVGAGLLERGLSTRRSDLLVAGGLAIGIAVLMKETSVVYVVLPVCLWVAIRPDRAMLGEAVGSMLAAAGIAWAWWLWVAFTAGRLYPTDVGGPVAIALVVASMPILLAGAAMTLAHLRGRPVDGEPGDRSPSRVGVIAAALAVVGAGTIAILWLGGGVQQAAVGDMVAGIVRFTRDRLLGEAGWLLPLIILGVASASIGWRSERPGIRVLLLLAILSVPTWFLTAEGARSLRSVAVPLLALVAVGAWSAERRVRVALEPSTAGSTRRRIGAAVALGLVVSIALGVVPRLREEPEAPQDWSAGPVVQAAGLIGSSVPRSSGVVVSWLYGNELYARTGGAYRMPQVPTVLLRVGEGAELRPVSTLYRFSPLTPAEEEQRIHELVWLRAVPSLRGYMGLSLPALLEELTRIDAKALVISGDSFQSTLDIAPVLEAIPGFQPLAGFGDDRDGIRVFLVSASDLELPAAWPLLLNGPTLQQLTRDLADRGIAPAELGSLIDAPRIELVEPATPDDHELLATLASAG
jgi:hypothetical protein